LDAIVWGDAIVLRVAPDEALALTSVAPEISDPHAIVRLDAGYAGLWLTTDEASAFLSRCCEWEPPTGRPAIAQGAVAGLPVKLWFEQNRVLVLVPANYAIDLEERIA
jgi:hypothetical protein